MFKLNKQGELFSIKVSVPFKHENKLYEFPLILDTGAAITLVDLKIIDYLGYSASQDGIRKSLLDSAVGRSEGYMIKISSFTCLGFQLPHFQIACHDLDTKLGVSGLLGMNFLKNFRIDMNYKSGEIFQIKLITEEKQS